MDAHEFSIKINAFADGDPIPKKFTPFGEDVNPEIIIQGQLPEKTQSLALVVADPDAPSGCWYHWLVNDIPVNTRIIHQNQCPGSEVINSWGIKKYKGPKPPSGTHHYYIWLFALNINTFEAHNPKQFMAVIQKHTIGKAQYIGTFKSSS